MNSNHQVKVVKIEEVRPHPNADRLEIIPIGGYQVVSQKGQFHAGDLAVYIQPDSVVPRHPIYNFLWDGKEINGDVPEKYRRVTVRRFRKEWSEGLLMKMSDYSIEAQEGDDVAEQLGISHYNPPEDDNVPDDCEKAPSVKQSRRWPKSLRGWYFFLLRKITLGYFPAKDRGIGADGNETAPEDTPPIYDVETFKNHQYVFQPGEQVIVTEKIHGSNARYLYRNGKMYAGSRKLWKKAGTNNIWRKVLEVNPDIERWCRDHSDYTLYGEVVPTQGGFHYGADRSSPRFFLFDIRSPKGEWLHPDDAALSIAISGLEHNSVGIESVPFLYRGPFDLERISKLVDGNTNICNGLHGREGIVIKAVPDRYVRDLGRVQLKIVSNLFLEKQK